MYHGYYSYIQTKLNQEYFIYLSETGDEITVSEVSKCNNYLNHKKYFSDSIYLGKLVKFVKIVKLKN